MACRFLFHPPTRTASTLARQSLISRLPGSAQDIGTNA
jgi:hypothetical protein